MLKKLLTQEQLVQSNKVGTFLSSFCYSTLSLSASDISKEVVDQMRECGSVFQNCKKLEDKTIAFIARLAFLSYLDYPIINNVLSQFSSAFDDFLN